MIRFWFLTVFILFQLICNARYYDAEQGGFISRDPVGYVIGFGMILAESIIKQ